MTFAEQTALHSYNQKNLVFYHTQGITNDQDADATPFLRQWFKIPKGKQRMALGDNLLVSVSVQALDNIICGFATYKEYYWAIVFLSSIFSYTCGQELDTDIMYTNLEKSEDNSK